MVSIFQWSILPKLIYKWIPSQVAQPSSYMGHRFYWSHHHYHQNAIQVVSEPQFLAKKGKKHQELNDLCLCLFAWSRSIQYDDDDDVLVRLGMIDEAARNYRSRRKGSIARSIINGLKLEYRSHMIKSWNHLIL